MAEIVNLRLVRKQKRRTEAQAEADRNRVVHGRSKGEKLRDGKASRALRDHVDAHLRERRADDDR